MFHCDTIKTASHIAGLQISLLHQRPNVVSNDYAVLFLHGSTFPSALSFAFRLNNLSWMDHLTANGYEVFALDFLGYGNSDRYPEMKSTNRIDMPSGTAQDAYKDVDKAIDLVCKTSGKNKVYLIGHSWGGSVAALYTEKFPDKVAKLVLFAAITKRLRTSGNEEEKIYSPYEAMTPQQRIVAMKSLTPENKPCQLEAEIFTTWGDAWLASDKLSAMSKSDSVRFPSGPSVDVQNLLNGNTYYDPGEIRVPVLVIRGEWDRYPDNNDSEGLFSSMEKAPFRKYVVIEKGTHVMHLEKSRHQLYDETLTFLSSGTNVKKDNRHAIAVIFEVIPLKEHKDEYLDIALDLKAELEKIDGFISIERFQSIYHPEKILSLSFWENEEAITKWRNLEVHRNAQAMGRKYIFGDYRLRVAQVIRDYGMFDRKEVPLDSRDN